jgi:integrase
MARFSDWRLSNGERAMEVHAIYNVEEISKMKAVLRQKNAMYALLFVMGINTAMRIGDLLSLSVGDVVDANGEIAEAIILKEKKTGKTKRSPMNEAIKKALMEYFACNGERPLAEPLFISRKGGALGRHQAWRVLKAAGESAGLKNIGTHSLRKTFGYHIYKNSGADIGLVQKLLNHTVSETTLRYIGIDREKMDNVCLELNL